MSIFTRHNQLLCGFLLDGPCPPLSVEDQRFSDILDRPLEITGTLTAVALYVKPALVCLNLVTHCNPVHRI